MVWHETLKGLLSRSGRPADRSDLASEEPDPVSQVQGLPTSASKPDTCLSVDLSRKQQRFEGWGTSLCWWAKVVGGFPEPLRSELVDLVFDPERGLGLQCARYNIGGSGWDHVDAAWLRYGADVDSFWGPQRQWDWSLDAGQRWVCQAAQARGCCFLEAFSNSPPYWMTWSGCASGNYQGWMDNLRPEFHDAFVEYLVTVVRHFRDEFGLNFRTLDPFNESTSTWWQRGGAQEGCHFGTPLQEEIVRKLAAALEAEGLTDSGTCVSASDETNIDVSLANMRAYQPDTMACVGQINTHAYWGSPESRTQLREFARAAGKRLWMSEFGCGNHPLGDIQSGLDISRTVLQDLNVLQATAWIYWQAIENTESNNTWGLLQTPFHPKGGQPDIRISKQYWALLQYSRWIRNGCTILACDNPDTLVATSQDPSSNSQRLVIVSTNFEDRIKSFAYDLGSAAQGSHGMVLDVHRTSPAEDCEHVGTFHLPHQPGPLVIPFELQPLSITTLVIEALQPSAPQCELEGDWAIV